MKIYVGCAIQGLTTEEYALMMEQIVRLKDGLRKLSYEVLDFKSITHRDSAPQEVFAVDYKQCMECDAMIAVALKPSTGLGMEVVYCLTRRDAIGRACPAFVFATAPESANASKLLRGCTSPHFLFEHCDEIEHIPSLFDKAFKEYRKVQGLHNLPDRPE
jgi:hypothetical protein